MAVVTFTPVVPKGSPLGVELADRAAVSGGVGGWEPVDRVRRVQTVEYTGTPLRQLDIPIVVSGLVEDGVKSMTGAQIEARMGVIESWGRPTKATGEPPVLTITGPVRHLGRRYVLAAVEWDNDGYLADDDGKRQQQFGTLTLLEYAAADVVVTRSAAKKHRAGKGKKPKTRTVTARSGDTLSRIAARELGKASRWREIRDLNPGLRDPDHVKAGTRLKVPA